MFNGKRINKWIKDFMSMTDLFGQKTELTINKEPKFHTITGTVVSIGIFGLVLYSFITLLIQLFSRSNPNIVQNTLYVKDPAELQLSPSMFFTAYSLTDQYGLPILQNNSALMYYFIAQACSRQTIGSKIDINCSRFLMKPCSQVQLNGTIAHQLNLDPGYLASFYCIDPNDIKNKNFSLEGTSVSQSFKYIMINILSCDQTTINGLGINATCASNSVIQSKLANGYIGMTVSDNILNQGQSGYPYSVVPRTLSTVFSVLQNKVINMRMQVNVFLNSENFYYYFPSNSNYTTLSYQQQTEYVSQQVSGQMASIIIMLSDNQIQYQRTYDNILNILGSVSGLMDLIVFCCAIFINPLCRLASQLQLIGQIYQFEKAEPEAKVYPKIQFEEMQNSVDVKRVFKLKHQSLNINIFEYFLNFQYHKKLESCITKVEKKLDIIYIINKLNEIEKLKDVLFSREQIHIFNLLPKPKIKLYSETMNISVNNGTYFTEENRNQHIKDAFSAYQELLDSSDPLNKKLIQMIDRDIKLIFDQNIPRTKQIQNPMIEINPQIESFIQSRNGSQIRQRDFISEINDIIEI